MLVAGQAHQVDVLGRLGVPFSLAQAPDLQPVRDVVDHCAVREQPEVLEDHRHVMPAQLTQPCRRHRAYVLAVDDDLTGGRLDQAGQTPHQRRLAGARQAHHDEDLALVHVKGHVLDRCDAAGPLLQLTARQVGVGGPDDPVGARAEDLPELAYGRGVIAHEVTPAWLRASPGGYNGLRSAWR